MFSEPGVFEIFFKSDGSFISWNHRLLEKYSRIQRIGTSRPNRSDQRFLHRNALYQGMFEIQREEILT